MLLKWHLDFYKKRSPEDIEMKKGSLIIVYHTPSCPVIYIIRNVLYPLSAFIARCHWTAHHIRLVIQEFNFHGTKLSNYSVTKLVLILQHSFFSPLWRVRLGNIQKEQVRSPV